jgi:hypothetical protein
VGDIIVTSKTGIAVTKTNGFKYFVDGKIAAVEPSEGVGGAAVSIYGTDLRGQGSKVESVTLSAVEATIVRESNYLVEVTAASSAAGAAGAVVLTADSGAVVSKTSSWTYAIEGNITSVSPAKGSAGALVTIEGANLRSGSTAINAVTIANVAAEIVSENNTVVVVRAGAIAISAGGTGDVVLTTADGSIVKQPASFTYITVSDIHSVSPSIGQYGTKVTISGVSLQSGATVKSVTLAGVEVSSITSQAPTKIVVVAAVSASAKVGDVVITSANGATVDLVNGWTYVAKPVVAAISPAEGQIGTIVTITGTTLLAGGEKIASGSLAGSALQEITSSNDTHIVGVASGNLSAVAGKVSLINDQSAEIESGTSLWTYRIPASKVATVAPESGQAGTNVVIMGSDLHGGGTKIDTVTLAGAAATIDSQSNTKVEVTATANSAGKGAVKLTADSGATTVLDNGFTYVAVGAVTSVEPSSGQLDTKVTITGTTMLGGGATLKTATLAGAATTITSGNDTYIVVVAKSGTAGVGAVVLTANTGAIVSSSTTAWTQLTDGNITSLSKSSGVLGVEVTISGTSLLAGGSTLSTVTLAGVEATISSAANDKVVVVAADAPQGAASDVVITADTGATVTQSSAWTYLTPGNITSVAPTEGQYGTVVVISGTTLFAGGTKITSVKLGGIAVDSIDATQSETRIQVVAPAANATNVTDIVMVSDIGTTVTGSKLWKYRTAGAVSTLTPNKGRTGTEVLIEGTSLRGARIFVHKA